MKNTPLISVIMPVKNGQLYLHESINSILQQNVSDFELIILNDHSSDQTHDIIKTFAETDKRIKYIKDSASGLVNNLNYGINISRGKYIARMDSDDISLPSRFEKQVELLEKTNCDLCGSAIEIIDKKCRVERSEMYPIDSHTIKETMIYKNCLAHPTVLTRSQVLRNNQYDPKYKYAQDLELWLRLIKRGYLITNHPEILLQYRKAGYFELSKTITKQKYKMKIRRLYFDIYNIDKDDAIELYKIEKGIVKYNHIIHDRIVSSMRNEYNESYIRYITRKKPLDITRIGRYIKYNILFYI